MSNRDGFTLIIYESELRQIQAWTAKYPNLETGGDLFGLWLDATTAVVQLVLGPGENCNRTSVSFYQDVDYLGRVGNHLTSKEGLCHIGEWHSHHRLGLTRPSGGDKNTVWTNMHRYGIHRFALFITTIGSSWSKKETDINDINIDGYLFLRKNGGSMKLQHCSFKRIERIPGESPFRKSSEKKIEDGAERLDSDGLQPTVKCRDSPSTTKSRDGQPQEMKTSTITTVKTSQENDTGSEIISNVSSSDLNDSNNDENPSNKESISKNNDNVKESSTLQGCGNQQPKNGTESFKAVKDPITDTKSRPDEKNPNDTATDNSSDSKKSKPLSSQTNEVKYNKEQITSNTSVDVIDENPKEDPKNHPTSLCSCRS